MKTLGYTVLHPDLDHTPIRSEAEANEVAANYAGALVVPVVDVQIFTD